LGDRSIVVGIHEVKPPNESGGSEIDTPSIISCNELDFGWILQESSLAEKKKMKISRRVFALLE
jgi:hypothetical protein